MSDNDAALKILAVGAVHAYLDLLAGEPASRKHAFNASFAPAGAVMAQVRDGFQADIVISTSAALDELSRDGFVTDGTAMPIGRTELALAQRAGAPVRAIASTDALRTLLLDVQSIYLPDTARSTAGQHMARLFHRLGILEDIAPKLRQFANGSRTMHALADSSEASAIGFTQRSEIVAVKALVAGPVLPADCALTTTYAAALGARSTAPRTAQRFIGWICGPDTESLRASLGFSV